MHRTKPSKSKCTYEKYEKLMCKVAHYYTGSTPDTYDFTFEEFLSECKVAFCQCIDKYNKEKGKFSTLLYSACCRRCLDYLKLKRNNRQVMEYLDMLYLPDQDTPEKQLIIKEDIEGDVYLSTALLLAQETNRIKETLTAVMQERGTPMKEIQYTYQTINTYFQEWERL